MHPTTVHWHASRKSCAARVKSLFTVAAASQHCANFATQENFPFMLIIETKIACRNHFALPALALLKVACAIDRGRARRAQTGCSRTTRGIGPRSARRGKPASLVINTNRQPALQHQTVSAAPIWNVPTPPNGNRKLLLPHLRGNAAG